MKRIVKLFIIISMFTLIVGCTKQEENTYIGEVSKTTIENDTDVSISIKEGSLTTTSAIIVLTNNGSDDYKYDSSYLLEIKKDNEWHNINVSLNFNLIAYELSPKENVEIEIKWENGYGTLESGEYRLVKNIDKELEDETYESFNIAIEFTI